VNEIVYAPAGDEPEWVEFYNVSPDSINLKNWKISDSNVSTKSIISATDIFITPESYLLVAKDVSFSAIHPNVFTLIANFPALNNTTPDAVILYDAASRTIDSVLYQQSWGGQNGRSLERIDEFFSSTRAENWGTSLDSLGSTPGKVNSRARLDYDLSFQRMYQTVSIMNGKSVPTVLAVVQNSGRYAVDSIVVRFYADSNRNTQPDQSEILSFCISPFSLAALDSVVISKTLDQIGSGQIDVIAFIDWWRDERTTNNKASVSLQVSYEHRSLIINEIMYDPLDNQNEWFELFNRSTQPVDIGQWTFNDKSTLSGSNSFVISDSTLCVSPGGFVVVAADSSLCTFFPQLRGTDPNICLSVLQHPAGLSFNNDGDVIVLRDLTGGVIDSVAYSPRWHNPDIVDTHGRSLERIHPSIDSNDPRNWSTCPMILGGTPGEANSILTVNTRQAAAISLSPNPFSPDGDGYEDYCSLRYNLTNGASILYVKIYDIKGRLVRTLVQGEPVGCQGEIIWNGFDDNKQCVRIGVYIVFLEASNGFNGKSETAKSVVVVAARF
jgi:hypothetical protein